MKVLLVAKPWRGGLANYVYSALDSLSPGKVEWVPTRPVSLADKLSYRANRKAWERRLVDKVVGTKRDLAFFINHLPVFSAMEPHAGNVLWLTDGPNPAIGDYAPYAKVFLSDPGHLSNVAKVLSENQLGGELGFAYSPDIHRRHKSGRERKQLCFIGNKDPKRDPYIEALLSSNLNVSVIGNYFLRHPLFWHHPRSFSASVANEQMGRIYADHQLSLNLHAKILRQGTNMRTFECAGYGIPQLVEYRPGLEKYFEPEKEILTFTEPAEMLEKVEQILNDAERMRRLSINAMKRAQAEHTYVHRIQTVLDLLS